MTYADEPGVDKHQSDIDAGGLRDGTELRVLYKQPDASPVNLVHAWFKPHFLLPRHTHNGDCLYYIILGSLQMGSRTLTSGDGFFVPADTRYGYQAGPDGVEVLEIRIAPEFDLRFTETEGRWHEIVKVAHENHTLWKVMVTPPSRQKAPDGDASLSGSP
jgi:quercetin dioxygenase-like cupin family protein